jgi:hypothetical protein
VFSLLRAVVLGAAAFVAAVPAQTADRLVAVFVVDGLRPDSINERDTPTIARLRREGAEYTNSHSVFPTVTRLNAATLVTGAYPIVHGIVANSMFVPGVSDRAPFDTGDYTQLLKLEAATGHAITTETLAEILQRNGRRLVTVSSGSTGNGYLLNPAALRGAGVVIHGLFDRGTIAAYPKEVSDIILERYGSPPPDPDDLGQMEWTDHVLREYVLPELRPDMVIDWMGPLDSSQHAHGVASPEAMIALRRIDESIARTLSKIRELGRLDRATVVVTSDHGFAHHQESVDMVGRLVAEGLKADRNSTDLIVASQSQSVLFYQDSPNLEPLVRFLQRQPTVDAVFTPGGTAGQGSVSGTFSFDLIGADHPTRAADVIASLAWTSDKNPHGVPGSHAVNGAVTGPLAGAASGHGGLNPWVVRNTLVAWGAGIQAPRRFDEPASLADITPTVLALLGIDTPAGPGGRGRVLTELITRAGSSARVSRRTLETRAGLFSSTIVISSVDGHDYVDSASRRR